MGTRKRIWWTGVRQIRFHLPGASGIECVRKLKGLLPNTNIMMLTAFGDQEHVYQALMAGATGYLTKPESSSDLLAAIAELHRGESPMSAGIARKVVTAFRRFGPPPQDVDNLSSREREVLAALAKGALYKEVADELQIAYDTVRTHVQNIYKKLHARSRSEAVEKYRRISL